MIAKLARWRSAWLEYKELPGWQGVISDIPIDLAASTGRTIEIASVAFAY